MKFKGLLKRVLNTKSQKCQTAAFFVTINWGFFETFLDKPITSVRASYRNILIRLNSSG